jgi:hypothetical protein
MPHQGRSVTGAPLATDFPPPEKYPNQAGLSTDTGGFALTRPAAGLKRGGAGRVTVISYT